MLDVRCSCFQTFLNFSFTLFNAPPASRFSLCLGETSNDAAIVCPSISSRISLSSRSSVSFLNFSTLFESNVRSFRMGLVSSGLSQKPFLAINCSISARRLSLPSRSKIAPQACQFLLKFLYVLFEFHRHFIFLLQKSLWP